MDPQTGLKKQNGEFLSNGSTDFIYTSVIDADRGSK
jgi:hypothetical protein